MSLTLALPWDASNDTKKAVLQRGSQQKAPRKRFMTEKLKNAAIQSEFTTELERKSAATREQLLQLQEQHARRALPTQNVYRSVTYVSGGYDTGCGGKSSFVAEPNTLRWTPQRRRSKRTESPEGPWTQPTLSGDSTTEEFCRRATKM